MQSAAHTSTATTVPTNAMHLPFSFPMSVPLPPPATVLTLPRMARRLGVTSKWLRDQVEAGRIPALPAGPGHWLLNVAAVDAAIEMLAAGPGIPPPDAFRLVP